MLENILENLKELLKYQPEHPMIFTTALFWIFFGLVLVVFQLTYKKLPSGIYFCSRSVCFFITNRAGISLCCCCSPRLSIT